MEGLAWDGREITRHCTSRHPRTRGRGLSFRSDMTEERGGAKKGYTWRRGRKITRSTGEGIGAETGPTGAEALGKRSLSRGRTDGSTGGRGRIRKKVQRIVSHSCVGVGGSCDERRETRISSTTPPPPPFGRRIADEM